MMGPAYFTRSHTSRSSQISTQQSESREDELTQYVVKLKEKNREIKRLRKNEKDLEDALDLVMRHLIYYHDVEKLRGNTETYFSQQNQIKSLQYQLTVANEKLKEYEARNKMVDYLQCRVTDLRCQLAEGETTEEAT